MPIWDFSGYDKVELVQIDVCLSKLKELGLEQDKAMMRELGAELEKRGMK